MKSNVMKLFLATLATAVALLAGCGTETGTDTGSIIKVDPGSEYLGKWTYVMEKQEGDWQLRWPDLTIERNGDGFMIRSDGEGNMPAYLKNGGLQVAGGDLYVIDRTSGRLTNGGQQFERIQ